VRVFRFFDKSSFEKGLRAPVHHVHVSAPNFFDLTETAGASRVDIDYRRVPRGRRARARRTGLLAR
jgi:hypothetical protein